mmetsp:Transcript_27261/g.62877  ORF Transcript_27261/g.62877 Transcript_27261/m.62877 type:complete len:203 (+) Transcript_27261:27-635(+)
MLPLILSLPCMNICWPFPLPLKRSTMSESAIVMVQSTLGALPSFTLPGAFLRSTTQAPASLPPTVTMYWNTPLTFLMTSGWPGSSSPMTLKIAADPSCADTGAADSMEVAEAGTGNGPWPPEALVVLGLPTHCAGRPYTPTTAAPPRPRLCCRAYLRLGTWRLPASPRSCQHSSLHWARPVAPRGWPLEIRPPLGLTTTRPP